MADWITLTLIDGTPGTFQVSWISIFGPISKHRPASEWALASIQIGADADNEILVKETADQIAALIGLRGALGRE